MSRSDIHLSFKTLKDQTIASRDNGCALEERDGDRGQAYQIQVELCEIPSRRGDDSLLVIRKGLLSSILCLSYTDRA